MPKGPKARYLPVVILPAIMPVIFMPLMVGLHVPDSVIGAAMGFSIGLAIVGIAWLAKGAPRCPDGT